MAEPFRQTYAVSPFVSTVACLLPAGYTRRCGKAMLLVSSSPSRASIGGLNVPFGLVAS